jgi:hypothetical protein
VLPIFPTVWLLLALPFVSTMVIRHVAPLGRLSSTHYHLTWGAGIVGLSLLFAGALGLLPASFQLPLMILGGSVAGFSMLNPPREDRGSDGEDWRWRRPPGDPPPKPRGDGPVDWLVFDQVRAQWERDSALERRG